MNPVLWQQINGQIRQAIPFFAGIAVAFGYLKADEVTALSDNVSHLLTSLGALAVSISAIWSFINKTRANIIASAAALPEVSKVVVSTEKLVDAMPAAAQGTVISTKTENASKF